MPTAAGRCHGPHADPGRRRATQMTSCAPTGRALCSLGSSFPRFRKRLPRRRFKLIIRGLPGFRCLCRFLVGPGWSISGHLEVPTYVLWHGFNSVKNDKSSAISVACYGILFDGFELFGTPWDPDEITKSSRDSLKGGNKQSPPAKLDFWWFKLERSYHTLRGLSGLRWFSVGETWSSSLLHLTLVGGFSPPLWKIWALQLGWWLPNWMEKKNMVQTNQNVIW